MSTVLAFRKRIENFFERLGYVLYRNRLKVLAIVFVFIGALVSQIPRLEVDMSHEAFTTNP